MLSGRLSSQFSYEVNENSLLLRIGPPSVAPHIFSFVPRRVVVSAPGVMASVGSEIAFMLGSLTFKYAEPLNLFVPDFMFREMMPPRLLPFSASALAFDTVTSSTASIEGV